MYQIRTYNQIALRGLERFSRDRFELSSEFAHPDAILLRSHKLTPADLTPDLMAIARAGAGVNNIPVAQCTEAGIVVFNTPGANANSVKELVLAALLLSSRDVFGGLQFVRHLPQINDKAELDTLVESEKKRFKGEELYGKTLGVVGLGAIGSLVAKAGLGLGMQVLGYDPAISVDAAWRLPSDVQRMENLHSLLGRCDYVSMHVPLLEATRGLINAESLKSIRPGCVLLNFARQEIVDEAALAVALREKQVRAYFSDFPSTELSALDNVYATPHLGASTTQAEENCAVMAADQLIDFLGNGNITNSVNFPPVYLDRTPGYRLALTNMNVPKMLGQVLSILANADINIVDMINKSRDDLAYNLIDVASRPGPGVLEQIRTVEGVVNVRMIENGMAPDTD